MKKYKLNIKRFLEQLNWASPDFPAVARMLAKDENLGIWIVTEDMLEEITQFESILIAEKLKDEIENEKV